MAMAKQRRSEVKGTCGVAARHKALNLGQHNLRGKVANHYGTTLTRKRIVEVENSIILSF